MLWGSFFWILHFAIFITTRQYVRALRTGLLSCDGCHSLAISDVCRCLGHTMLQFQQYALACLENDAAFRILRCCSPNRSDFNLASRFFKMSFGEQIALVDKIALIRWCPTGSKLTNAICEILLVHRLDSQFERDRFFRSNVIVIDPERWGLCYTIEWRRWLCCH